MDTVIFRKFPNGEIIALFPYEPVTADCWNCGSYMHIGQHGAASQNLVNDTKLATTAEYANLKKELEDIGYALDTIKKFPRDAYSRRRVAQLGLI